VPNRIGKWSNRYILASKVDSNADFRSDYATVRPASDLVSHLVHIQLHNVLFYLDNGRLGWDATKLRSTAEPSSVLTHILPKTIMTMCVFFVGGFRRACRFRGPQKSPLPFTFPHSSTVKNVTTTALHLFPIAAHREFLSKVS
jgi:hypothetical protein